MAMTPHLGLTLVEQAQAQKEVTVNMALMRIDALLNSSVIDKDLTAPPASPVEGDVYIVAAAATGDWTGKDGQIAYFEQIWRFIAPNEGVMLWVQDEAAFYVYTGGSWGLSASGGGGGEANTGQNASGETGGVFKNKSAASLVFNNLVAGSNVSISGGGSAGGDIVISSTGGGGGATALDGLSDVGLSAPAAGEVLFYNAGTSTWQNGVLGVAGGGTGMMSATADCLLRGNGTASLQTSGVQVDAQDAISGFKSAVKTESGAAYTLTAADTGKVVELSHGSAITLTLPNNLPKGFTATLVQLGVGVVSFSAASGAVYHNRSGYNATAGQYAVCTLYVSSNSDGSSAVYVLAGDLA